MQLLKIDFKNPKNTKLIILMIVCLLLFALLAVILFSPQKEPTTPKNTKPVVVKTNEDQSLILYKKPDGKLKVESSDYRKTDSVIRKELNLDPNQEYELYLPGPALPRNPLPDDLKPTPTPMSLQDKWGIYPDYKE